MTPPLESCPALVLNADFRPLSYFPLSLWSWQETIKAVFLERVNIVSHYDHVVRSPNFEMRLPEGQRAIVGFSGMVASAPTVPEAGKKLPAILLIHGTADPVVPFASLAGSEAALVRAGFSVETMERPGLGHGIDGEGAQRAALFLAGHL